MCIRDRVIPGTTKLIIAQRISSVEDADLIIVLDDGQISARGTNDELLESSAIYEEISETQKTVSYTHLNGFF